MKKQCPIIKSECMEHGCQWFIHLLGMNPQTGVNEDQWGCAVSWLPLLLVENANMMRQATASTDKVANEVRRHHVSFLDALDTKIRIQSDIKNQISHNGTEA